MKIFSNTRKKGLDFGIITGMIIALIVLVVLIFIFTGRASIFSKGMSACEERGGKIHIVTKTQTSCPEGHSYLFDVKSENKDEKKICCFPN